MPTPNVPAGEIKIPSGEEVYNAIMGRIDPDLLTGTIPTLETKYKGESEMQRAARLERYKKAYKEYDRQYAAWTQEVQVLVARARREALQSAEKKERVKEEQILQSLDSQMTAA
ncbi:hypothetical protein A2635_04955 [Candidatus Peribacteria bacterium RIFCSPHIGHO2_01_FULL_51_9]|nr:MAG: hypothetical protein A2635_04955 [Candidatus Peribacteria bacterium RIFCSPHIGHO2_01_FULL_51_9]